jgi:hypothetical protein
VLSPAAVRSRGIKRELLFALYDRRFEDRIVPVVYRDGRWARPSWTLDAIQSVDFPKGFEAGWEGLSRLWALPAPGGARAPRRRRR